MNSSCQFLHNAAKQFATNTHTRKYLHNTHATRKQLSKENERGVEASPNQLSIYD